MAEATGISWTDSTFNPWIGCTKVGPGCDHCYAEAADKRFTGGAHWGPGAPRRRTTAAYWRNLRKWNAKASEFQAKHGHRQRVFIASQADVFDNAVPQEWRDDLWHEIELCTELEIIIVTKRVGNVEKMQPTDGLPSNVILLATVVNQAEYDRDEPKLSALDVNVGLSIEPMLGPIDLGEAINGLAWIICGGESGTNARPSHPGWFRSLRDQCAAAGVPFFFKQHGEWMGYGAAGYPNPESLNCGLPREPSAIFEFPDREVVFRVGRRAAGDLLDGRQRHEFPRAS